MNVFVRVCGIIVASTADAQDLRKLILDDGTGLIALLFVDVSIQLPTVLNAETGNMA